MRLASTPTAEINVNPEIYIRKVIEGWFLDTPIIEIYEENFLDWCGWAFFGKVRLKIWIFIHYSFLSDHECFALNSSRNKIN